jgi:hypothetical protein
MSFSLLLFLIHTGSSREPQAQDSSNLEMVFSQRTRL